MCFRTLRVDSRPVRTPRSPRCGRRLVLLGWSAYAQSPRLHQPLTQLCLAAIELAILVVLLICQSRGARGAVESLTAKSVCVTGERVFANEHVLASGEVVRQTTWRTRVAAALTLYFAYLACCFCIESFGRHRFAVERDTAIQKLQPTRARLLAVTRKATALSELENWWLYRVYTVGSVTLWTVLAGATAISAARRLRRRSAMSVLGIDQYVIVIVLSSSPLMLLGLLPPLLLPLAWERFHWMSW